MLQPIVEYGQKNGITPEPGFKPKEVKWAIKFSEQGDYLDVVELGDAGQKKNPGKTFEKCPTFSFSEMLSGGTAKSHFLADALNIVALYGVQEDDTKSEAKHAYFVNLLREASQAFPVLGRIGNALDFPDTLARITSRLGELKARPTDKATIRVGNVYPIENEACLEWWRKTRQELADLEPDSNEVEMMCFVTGRVAPAVKTHPKVERLADVGGMPAGDVLMGFDKEAFQSYGLRQSENAAVCEQGALAYVSSLNHLIKNHSHRLAGAKVVYWYKDKVAIEDDPVSFILDAAGEEGLEAQERARKLLESIRTGKKTALRDNFYYALTLSGASGRVMVRDYMEGSFESLALNVQSWFSDLSIVSRTGDALAPSPKFFAVLGGCVRDLDDLPPPFIATMWKVALTSGAIPTSTVARALHRARTDIIDANPFNHARMGLLKAYIIRKHEKDGGDDVAEKTEPYLNEEHPSTAYQCGRLMALLGGLQRSALGDVGAGVVQRYYAAASSTPALVLGRLSRMGQFHLGKLEPGLAHWYEDKLSAIWSALGDKVPRTLDLEGQTLFALGYYQQLGDMRKRRASQADDEEEV